MKRHLEFSLFPPKIGLQPFQKTSTGFTLVEVLIVVIMLGLLAIIGGASYLAMLERIKVSAAQIVALNAIRQAQITARQRNATWQASFRESNGRIYWAVHSPNVNPIWSAFEQNGVIIDAVNTTFYQENETSLWRVQFNYKGQTNGRLGRITLSNFSGNIKRCTFVSTLLGAIRSDRDSRCKR